MHFLGHPAVESRCYPTFFLINLAENFEIFALIDQG
jgi:hypothetical protein